MTLWRLTTSTSTVLEIGTDLLVDSLKRICTRLDPFQLLAATNLVVALPSSVVAFSSSTSLDVMTNMANVAKIAKAVAIEVAGNE